MNRRWRILLFLTFLNSMHAYGKTVDDRVAQFGEAAGKRMAPFFEAAGISYPPAKVALIGLKQEREVQLYAAGTNGPCRFIRSYPILAASGNAGPKLREGDSQVPEGLYRIESLNPNSSYHLSLRVNYPNEFDRAQAKAEGRVNLGGDIMIHGKAVSIGCLAMGDLAAEELFVLAARTGLPNIQVILCPVDFRLCRSAPPCDGAPQWLGTLYERIKTALLPYEVKKPAGAAPLGGKVPRVK